MIRLICLALFLGLVSCSSPETVKPAEEKPVKQVEKKQLEEKKAEEKVVVKETKDVEPVKQIDAFEVKAQAQNKQLEKTSIEKFKLGSSEIPQKQWNTWAKKAAPIVKELINMMPENYVLEIRGHADIIGSESANEKLSEARAYAVYKALLKQGIKEDKLTYKGLGSSMMIESVKKTDPRQRRVSFKVVKK